MPDVIITYDVDSKHVEVKARMKALGYVDYIEGSSKTYLPNTTLLKTNTTPVNARDQLLGVCDSLKVQLQRVFALYLSPQWAGIVGAPHD